MDFALTATPVTLAILIATVVVSLAAFAHQGLRAYLSLEPCQMVRTRQYHQVITSGFVHADFAHLAVNMLTLYFFGRSLEGMIVSAYATSSPFVGIYLSGLVLGSLYPLLKYRHNESYGAVGASGAISGIVFAFCLAQPTALIYVFFSIPMPAWLYAILYTAYSMYGMRRANDNIGHEAHIAGAIGGMVAAMVSVPAIVTVFQRLGLPWFG